MVKLNDTSFEPKPVFCRKPNFFFQPNAGCRVKIRQRRSG